LGLTKVQILPHYQKVKDWWLDGKRLFEDITCADSLGRCFYALPDFSYVVDDGKGAILYGEAYRLQDGVMTQITAQGENLRIK
jgi:dipeptidase E